MSAKLPQTPAGYERTRTIERPDGIYWQDMDSGREYGPFATLLEAVQDMESAGGSDFEPGETLEEAESEIGVSDWIDADTGEPGEFGAPRIEEH